MIEVYWVDTDSQRRWETRLLDAEEKARADAMLQPSVRERWIRSRIALREILAEKIRIRPQEVHYTCNSNGRPQIESHNYLAPRFSLSRSGSRVCISVRFGGAIGVDLENCRRVAHRREKIERFFCSNERDELTRVESRDCDDAFLRVWTAKEAWLKANGLGIQHFPVTQACVSLRPTLHYCATEDGHPETWALCDVSANESVASVAWKTTNDCTEESLSIHHFS